jgi:hypothetical protein
MRNFSKNLVPVMGGLAVALLAACSNLKTPATSDVAVSGAAVDSAVSAGGSEFAPVELNAARSKLAQARQALSVGVGEQPPVHQRFAHAVGFGAGGAAGAGALAGPLGGAPAAGRRPGAWRPPRRRASPWRVCCWRGCAGGWRAWRLALTAGPARICSCRRAPWQPCARAAAFLGCRPSAPGASLARTARW